MHGTVISDDYQKQNAELHTASPDYGNYGAQWGPVVSALMQAEGHKTVLDYGCGKGELAKYLNDKGVIEYDPAIPGKGFAVPAELVVCTDVLEHIEPLNLDAVLTHLYSVTEKKLFFNIATRPSSKSLSDGRNAHLIIRDGAWWRSKLEENFQIDEWQEFPDEITGQARPLHVIDNIGHTMAVSDDERNSQVTENIKRISKRVTMEGTLAKLPAHDRKAIVVCGGPSLHEMWPEIKMAHFQGVDIFTTSNAHGFMIERGIIPLAHIDCDPREHKARQFGEPNKKVKYWLASCCHPSYLDKLEGFDVALWHSFNGPKSLKAIQLEPTHRMIMGGGSVGLRAISLLYYLGYRHFEIYGMDCSFKDGEAYAAEHLGKKKSIVRVRCKDRWFETSAVFILYARYFAKQCQWLPDAVFNLHGNGLLQYMHKEMT